MRVCEEGGREVCLPTNLDLLLENVYLVLLLEELLLLSGDLHTHTHTKRQKENAIKQ